MIPNDYPFNLIRAIYGDYQDDNTHTETTYIKGLHEQIGKLSKTEQACLTLRYKEGLTLKACGDHYRTTAQSIRRIIQVALRKLRHPSRTKHFAAIPVIQLHHLENQNWKLHEENRQLKAAMNALQKTDIDPHTIVLLAGMIQPEHLSAHIGALNLSTRAYNALSRAGIKTVRDVLAMSEESLKDKRSIGEKTMTEIKTKIKAYILLPEGYRPEPEDME